jgi:hypothetical protein
MTVMVVVMTVRMRVVVIMAMVMSMVMVARRVIVLAIRMVVVMVMDVIVSTGRPARQPPQRDAANSRNDHERDAAGQHEEVELRAEQESQHRLRVRRGCQVGEIQGKANGPKRPRNADHADLVEVERVAVVVVIVGMVVRVLVRMIVGVIVMLC